MGSKVLYVANVTPLPGFDSSMVFASCLGDPVQVGDELVRLGTEEKYEVRSAGGGGVRFNPAILKHLQCLDTWSFSPDMGEDCCDCFLVEPGAVVQVLTLDFSIQEIFQPDALEPGIPIAIMVEDNGSKYSGILWIKGKTQAGTLRVVAPAVTPFRPNVVRVHLLSKVLGDGPAFSCSLKPLDNLVPRPAS